MVKSYGIKGNATKIALKSGKTKLPLKLVGGLGDDFTSGSRKD